MGDETALLFPHGVRCRRGDAYLPCSDWRVSGGHYPDLWMQAAERLRVIDRQDVSLAAACGGLIEMELERI